MVTKILKVLGLILLVTLIVMQFFPIDKSAPESDPALDFMTIHSPPDEVASIIKSVCYDCHSYETDYPWYSNVAPVSWWLQEHIEHGREELNFSLWAEYSTRRADHKLEEAAEMVEDEEMPLPSYTWAHAEARLTDEQRSALTTWFEKLRQSLPEETESE